MLFRSIQVNKELPNLLLMPAGSPFTEEYLDLLGDLDVRRMFDGIDNPGFDVFALLKDRIAQELEPDYLLIDARTGLTHIGTVALQLLTDVAVCLFSCTNESYEGSVGVMKSVSIGNSSQETPTEIYPVISRVSSSAEGAQLEQTYRKRLKVDLPKGAYQRVIVLHTDVGFEADDRPSVNLRRSLTESTLMSDMLSAARTLFSDDAQVCNVLDQLNLPRDLNEAEDLQPPVPIVERMRLREQKARAQGRGYSRPVFVLADIGYVPGSAYHEWMSDLVRTLVNHFGYSSRRIERIDSEYIVLARVPEQMRNGALDFCTAPYYIKKSRQLLLGYFPFAFVRSFELVTEANSDIDRALRLAYQSRPKAMPWTLRAALDALFSHKSLNFGPKQLLIAKDTTSATECQRVVAEILLDGSASQIGQKERVIDLKARLGKDVLVLDHGTISTLFGSMPPDRSAQFPRNREHLRVFYEPWQVPVGLIYPREDTQWGRAIADAVGHAIRSGNLSQSRWTQIAADLSTVGIDAISFQELQIIATRGMSFDKAFDWCVLQSEGSRLPSVAWTSAITAS